MPFREQHIMHFKTLKAIRPPRVMSVIAWMLVIGLTTGALFLTFTPWVQTAPGAGRVTALNPNDRVQEINAFVSGRIAEWYVRDGSLVKEGDPIVRIVDNDPQLLSRLEAERNQTAAKLNAAETALATAEIDLRRSQGLFNDGLAARRDVELARIKVEDFKARVAEAAAELNRVDVNMSRQSAQIVAAPRNGQILKVNAGDASTFISTGALVATFIPTDAPRAVELFIDGRDVPLVRPGDKVRIEFEGLPAIQISGWPTTALGTFGGDVVAVDPSSSPDGRFRVLIAEDPVAEPWPEERFARFGSTVRGWILLGTVPVGYELWRQLNNFPPQFDRIGEAPEGGPSS